jgi:hypothetical protein
MASIKIYDENMSAFFDNQWGDGANTVEILEKPKPSKTTVKADFLGHFTVKTKAFLSGYDCDDSIVYEFKPGRYFVYLIKPMVFRIEKIDMDLHA